MMRKFRRLHWFFQVIIPVSILVLISFFLAFIAPQMLPTNKITSGERYGIIFQNEQWSGDIRIVGDVYTMPGVTITIDPGTHINVAKKGDVFNLDFTPSHLKSGINTGPDTPEVKSGEPFFDEGQKISMQFAHLFVWGTSDRPVVWSSPDHPGSSYDINNIVVNDGEIHFVQFSNYRKLQITGSVIVKNSSFTNTSTCALCVVRGNPTIEWNTFSKNMREDIYVHFASPMIKHNSFNESEEGIFIDGDGRNTVVLTDNKFYLPGKTAVKINLGEEGGVITRNTFLNGDIFLPCNSNVRLSQNVIRGNVFFYQLQGCNGNYTLDANYWEMVDKPEKVLQARVKGTTPTFQVFMPYILTKPPFAY